MRPDLKPPPATEHAVAKMSSYQRATVEEVRTAVTSHDVVVVGMGWNPHVRRARRALDEAGVAYHYLGYGNYLSAWRQRLALKIWAGWPTFPQVFVRGVLVGGADQTKHLLAEGGLDAVRAA